MCCGVNHRPSGPRSRRPHEGRPYLRRSRHRAPEEPVGRDLSGGVASPHRALASHAAKQPAAPERPKTAFSFLESQVCAACPTCIGRFKPRGLESVMPAATTLRQPGQPPAPRAVPRLPQEEVVVRPVCLAGWPRVAYLLPFSRGLLRQRTGRDCRGHPHRSRLDPPR